MVDFGIQLGAPAAEEMGERHTYYRDVLTRGADAFSSFWVSDHLMEEDNPTYEGSTALAYLAAEFPTHRVGNLVLSQSYRNPARLARWPRHCRHQSLVDAGVEMFSMYFHDRRSLDVFAREVVPAFRMTSPGGAPGH